jgi:membrane protein DedA with SNARE-associated domain/rhodanese-related sulfurtransferase
MMGSVDDLISLVATQGPALVFVVTLAARLGAPFPAAPFLVVAGGMSLGHGALLAVVAAAMLGNILGDGAWFLAGRRWGYRVLRLLCRISLSADSCVRRSEDILGRWGGMSLIAAKFVPGVSVVAPPMAGALGMSTARFLSYESVGALIWTLGFVMLGRVFQTAIQDVLALLSNIGLAAGGLLLLAFAAFVAWRWQRRRLAMRAEGIEHIVVDALREALAGAPELTVIDVRSARARTLDGRVIPGAVGIPLRELPERARSLADARDIVVFCDCPNDVSAIAAARVLMKAGLPRVRVLAGGLDAWLAAEAAAEDLVAAMPVAAQAG